MTCRLLRRRPRSLPRPGTVWATPGTGAGAVAALQPMPAAETMAVFAATLATNVALHSGFDLWGQSSRDAGDKDMHGDALVYAGDGAPVDAVEHRPGARTCTVSQLGRAAATRHVAVYTFGQMAAVAVVLRVLGYRVPLGALVAGGLVTGVPHWVIDRRRPLFWLADRTRHRGFLDEATVMRRPGEEPDDGGPGSALYELDAALHLGTAVAAALVTALVTARTSRGGAADRRRARRTWRDRA